jgi:hypothetical protein
MAYSRLSALCLLLALVFAYPVSTQATSTAAAPASTPSITVHYNDYVYHPNPARRPVPPYWAAQAFHPKFLNNLRYYQRPQQPTASPVNPALITTGPSPKHTRPAGGYWVRRFRPGTRRPSLDRFEDVWVPVGAGTR